MAHRACPRRREKRARFSILPRTGVRRITRAKGSDSFGTDEPFLAATLACLPHRFPMRMLDKLEYLSATTARGFKNLSANEPWFPSTAGSCPRMLIIESMAQLAGFLVITPVESGRRAVVLVGISKARFTRSAFPGQRLEMEANLLRLRGGAGWVSVSAAIGGGPICTAKLSFGILKAADAAASHEQHDTD